MVVMLTASIIGAGHNVKIVLTTAGRKATVFPMDSINDLKKELADQFDPALAQTEITPDNIYQPGLDNIQELIKKYASQLLLPGSELLGGENLRRLSELSSQGKPCLIMMEHFSNLDLPNFYILAERHPDLGRELTRRIIAMAGLKLNEESPFISALIQGFSRIVIYPSRSLEGIQDPEEWKKAKARSTKINRSSIHEMTRAKYNGKVILVFPSGTRYRPWEPDSARGLKEMASYLRAFEYACFVSINGNTLRIQQGSTMMDDKLTQDVVLFKASPVFETQDFREKALAEAAEQDNPEPKKYVAQKIMDNLARMHAETEDLYRERLSRLKA